MLTNFPFFNVAYYNYKCHSDISVVIYKVLLLNILISKLFILNQHGLLLVIQTGFLQLLHRFYSLFLYFLAQHSEYR